MTNSGFGKLLKEWRALRHLSQLDLAHEAGVSARHLSFVESGRSNPSPELVLDLARHLSVPFRRQNDLLLAAGFAPRFDEISLRDPAMSRVSDSLQRLLKTHEPYPGLVLDHHWNVVMANSPAQLLVAGLPEHLTAPPLNIFRLSLHPEGLAEYTTNFTQWANYLLDKLHRLCAISNDPDLRAIEAEVLGYGNVDRSASSPDSLESELLIPYDIVLEGQQLSMFTTLTSFGTPRDITLEGLAVELFYPNNEVTEAFFHDRFAG